MTSYGPAYPGGPPYGPPPGGYGPPPGGPVAGARPSSPLWPIIVVTLFFALFGLIPTIIASNKASQRREDSSRYWLAFGLSLLGAFVLYAIVVVLVVFVVLAGTVAVVGAAANAIPSIDVTSGPTHPAASSAARGYGATSGPCGYTPSTTGATAATLPADPSPTPTTTRTWTLVITAGTIVVELDGSAAPCTVQSIVHLTQQGFYDHTTCPRSVDRGLFILQCGDPTGTGTGGPGYVFSDENLAGADYVPGAVAMANRGPDTNGSQFFLVDKDANGALSKSYTVFGSITTGQDALDKIVAAGNDGHNGAGDGTPTPPVSIVTATIT